MSDRRSHYANGFVAHSSLKGTVESPRFTDGTQQECCVPVTDICASPAGARDKQLLFGQAFQVLEARDGWSFGFCAADGYAGYVRSTDVSDPCAATHYVSARACHVYSESNMKSSDRQSLPFGAIVQARAEGDFFEISAGGFIARQHLSALPQRIDDPVSVAEMLLGTPYLWGGDSAFGIDCSGLVQTVLRAGNQSCPRDTDQQFDHWAKLEKGTRLQRGDLAFWKGHVGILLDDTRLIHANAHHMQVAIEPFDEAVARIARHEFGDLLGLVRP